jgi:excisionase family DNA binding protein
LRGTQKEQLTVGVSNLEINEICELKPWDLPDSVKKSVLRDDDALALEVAAELQRRSEYARLKPKARRALEACAVLGISRATLYKLAAQGKIRLVKIAGRTLVPESEIDRLASEGTAEWGVADVP